MTRFLLRLAGNVCAICGKPIPVGQVMCSKCATK